MAHVIDGKAIAKEIRARVKEEVEALKAKGVQPSVDVVLVGEDPGSLQYARSKERTAGKLGIEFRLHQLPESASQEEVEGLIKRLSDDPKVYAIMLELPLPKHLEAGRVLELINPAKDVDGLNPASLGRLAAGLPCFAPNTPQAVIRILEHEGVELLGKRAVVIGRSVQVGKPLFFLLLARHATVTVCHSKTRELGEITRQAEVLVVAAGRAGLVKGDMIMPGAVVIDVGTNVLEDGTTVGDVDFDSAKEVAGMITPVPGGVGPVTTATLFENVVEAAKRNSGVA
ncbi:bifunctional methylenetetrahydrofolate dehydrogenase/methenyltetrahydrofolate cyclohydrolase [Candidatus Bathyarchaeota archaeon]|nr:MAG: bifunctional methylenetetrahydrofolate dehydrogenase/methenyltetrahydrofolate cyclohydrolase [Candidatus Bathyarchaeota archaeon]